MEIHEVVVKDLMNRNETVSVAESCTGGMVASLLVDVAGVSECFHEGYVTYSNDIKHKNLNVSQEILDSVGAVSFQCARAMAVGVREKAGTTYGLATTGIAGPDGGSEETPVGCVYIACATADDCQVYRLQLEGSRHKIREDAAYAALELLKDCIRGAV